MRTITCDRATCVAFGVVLTALAGALPCAAQQDEAGARALFDQGRKLRETGDWQHACIKFEAASKLYAGSGLLVNLADCYEHVGRTATAWTTFGDAVTLARQLHHADDEAEATKRQKSLEPRLSRLTVTVAGPVAGLAVKRDGLVLETGAWGTPIPVDPGPHTVRAEAPDRSAWSSTVSVSEPGETVTVRVPELTRSESPPPLEEPEPVKPSPPATAPGLAPYWTGRRILGAAGTGVGVIALGVGGIVALSAKSLYDSATNETGAREHNDSVSAVNRGNVATALIIAGGVVGAAGLLFWLTAPSEPGGSAVGTDGREIFFARRF